MRQRKSLGWTHHCELAGLIFRISRDDIARRSPPPRQDPVAFIRDLDGAVIDEVQRAPEILLAIKRSVDWPGASNAGAVGERVGLDKAAGHHSSHCLLWAANADTAPPIVSVRPKADINDASEAGSCLQFRVPLRHHLKRARQQRLLIICLEVKHERKRTQWQRRRGLILRSDAHLNSCSITIGDQYWRFRPREPAAPQDETARLKG